MKTTTSKNASLVKSASVKNSASNKTNKQAAKNSIANPLLNPLFEALSVCLANSYMLYLKTQNYHWNVTGPSFHALHTMFQAQYEDLALSIDTTAERIRALGFKAYGSFSQYSKLTTISEGNENETAQNMITDLLHSQAQIIQSLENALLQAQKLKDEATINIIVDRIETHQKNAWMLSSSL